MAIHYRKRGKVWHVRGTIRVGRRVVRVPEHSTGCQIKSEAEAVGGAEEARIRAEALDATAPRARIVTIGECIAAYRARPGDHHPFDESRLSALATIMGSVSLPQARTAWGAWLREQGSSLAPSTIARWRSTLRAALSYGADEFGVQPPTLRPIQHAEAERIAYLTRAQEGRLLAAYSPWASPVMLVLCETGMRSQEALRLDWRCVDWRRNVIVVEHTGQKGGARTKTGRSRSIGMRPIVRQTMAVIWERQAQPESGAVFLSRRGKPYADTRRTGGNPLTKAHLTACKNVGITGFRVHDWRHHFAVWFLKRGGNIRALCQVAGWSSMRMVQRYAVFEQSDLDDIMLRTAANVPRATAEAEPLATGLPTIEGAP